MSWHFHLSFFLSLAKIQLSEGESKSLLAPPSTMVVCLIMTIRKHPTQARPKAGAVPGVGTIEFVDLFIKVGSQN